MLQLRKKQQMKNSDKISFKKKKRKEKVIKRMGNKKEKLIWKEGKKWYERIVDKEKREKKKW